MERLTSELDKLEAQIRNSIERATGYGLFHSFQTRQEQLVKEKQFWAKMLALAVGVSLFASTAFIISLHWVTTYNAAFYLKLSISIPLAYAIAFCSIQYSRERRLEEEYAFKSNVSISLDPYQRLVAQLINKDKPEEVAKHADFVIDSVSRVFTSPTENVFDGAKKETGSAPEKVIGAVTDFAKPLVDAIKSR